MKVVINEKRELKSLKVLLKYAENLVTPLIINSNSEVLKDIYRSINSASSKIDTINQQSED